MSIFWLLRLSATRLTRFPAWLSFVPLLFRTCAITCAALSLGIISRAFGRVANNPVRFHDFLRPPCRIRCLVHVRMILLQHRPIGSFDDELLGLGRNS